MEPIEIPQETVNFFMDIEQYGINHDFKELQFSRGKINYDRILKKLETVELPDPLSLTYSTLTKDELTNFITEILCKIFGSDLKPKIEEFNKLIVLKNIKNPFDAILETELKSPSQFEVLKNIHISKKCASIEVISTSHEYTHCLVSKYTTHLFNQVLNNIHYKELLPVIVEYIVCYELSLILKTENLREKHQIIRIDYDKNQTMELLECLKLRQMAQRELKGKNLNDAPLMKYFEYQEHNAFTYILADMYGSYLCNVYQTSPEELISIIKRIFDGESCINDLISYFNLSLKNMEIIDNYSKQIEHVSLQKSK